MGSRWLSDDPFKRRGGIDLTNNFLNIDRLCDILVNTQKQNGEQVSFDEKKYEDDDELPVKKKPKETGCVGNCQSCKDEKDIQQEKPKRLSDIKFLGLLGISEDDDDDEEDFYLCEYCDALGYKQKYDASRCDSCTVCESCEEYDTGECSGCTYSIYREGSYYRDRVNAEELFDADDNKILKELESDNISSERLDNSRFSLLD